jgi:hypothetical protein
MLKRKIHTLTTTYEHCTSKSEKHMYIDEDREREE